MRTASELGLHGRTIERWLRGAPKRHFRRVEVAPAGSEKARAGVLSLSVTLVVFVGAVRIEGLDLEGLVRPVRALGA